MFGSDFKSMSVSKQIESHNATGIYLHVPFCASTCDFCAFYQKQPRRSDLEAYLNGIEAELKLLNCKEPVSTVFWGGGTPGLLPAKDLERLAGYLHAHLNLDDLCEWTVEMAPSTVKMDKLKVLAAAGVTRISMGVQSFQPELLDQLGRLHQPNQIYQAYDHLQAIAAFQLNLDLIFAIPGQTESFWVQDMNLATAMRPDHLSTYCLTFEEDTALWLKLSKGQLRRDEELESRLYEKTWEYLAGKGYQHYEVSNFCQPECECKHNVNTWEMQSWIGLGPSASSQYRGKRFTHVHEMNTWLKGVHQGSPVYQESVVLDDLLLATDALVFGLRMNRGVCLDTLKTRYPSVELSRLDPLWAEMRAHALLVESGARLQLSDKGRLLADWVGSQIIERMEYSSKK